MSTHLACLHLPRFDILLPFPCYVPAIAASLLYRKYHPCSDVQAARRTWAEAPIAHSALPRIIHVNRSHPECFVCMCAGGFMQLQCFHARTVHKCVCLCLTHRQGPAAWPGILRFGELYGCVRVRRLLPPAPACGCGCAAPTYGCVRVRVQAHFPPPAPVCGCGALTYGCVRVRVTTGAGDQRVRRPARTRIHP